MSRVGLIALSLLVIANFQAATSAAPIILLNGDSPATGSQLGAIPLVTPFGPITFAGEFLFGGAGGDPEFLAAGSLRNVFDIADSTSTAQLTFGFDVVEASFIYGGNSGVFDIQARDIVGNVVDSFFQSSTYEGQPAGPITLSGVGIRSLVWRDPGNSFAPIDNVMIVPAVPEPSTLAISCAAAMLAFAFDRRRKQP